MVRNSQKPAGSTEGEAAKEGLREANKREKAERIRDAALALFREKGFEATTTREVAERAGIATGTLFLYVQNKDELIAFVFQDEIMRVVEARFATLPTRRDVVEQLTHVFGGLLEFYAKDPALSRLLLREVLFSRKETSGMNFTLEFVARVGAMLDEAETRGELALTAPSTLLAHQLFALYLGAVLAVVSEMSDAAGATEYMRGSFTVHLAGMRPATKKKGRPR